MLQVIHSLDPLRRLRSLLTLDLNMTRIGITNGDIPALGKAWPNLEDLTIRPNAALNNNPPGLTLAALPLFATHLPTLCSLTTGLDATTPWPPSHLDAPPARSLRPIQLLFESSPLTEGTWLGVAAYISNVYPNAYGQIGRAHV